MTDGIFSIIVILGFLVLIAIVSIFNLLVKRKSERLSKEIADLKIEIDDMQKEIENKDKEIDEHYKIVIATLEAIKADLEADEE